MNNNVYETRDEVTEKVLKIYNYGSRVYGVNKEDSDYDYIYIVESDNDHLYYSVEKENLNITVYSEQHFIELIKEHKVHILECIFQDMNDPYLKYFELNKEKLRRAFSSVASNSFVKCKKKLKQGETYIGLKSLFHSLRILSYGIMIAVDGRITNYSIANKFYDMIFEIGNNWEMLESIFKPIYNSMKSQFRLVAPLEGEIND